MSLRGKLDRLQKTMQGKLSFFELADGQRYYFEPQRAFWATFRFFTESMTADYKREPRPDPPAVLKAVAGARDRSEALNRVMDGGSHLPLDRTALVGRGEFVPRSLVAGREYADLGVPKDLGE